MNGHAIHTSIGRAGNAYANLGLYEPPFGWRTRGLELALELADRDEGELLSLSAQERAEGLSKPDELQRRAEVTIWEAHREDREDRERAARFLGGLHTAKPADPREPWMLWSNGWPACRRSAGAGR